MIYAATPEEIETRRVAASSPGRRLPGGAGDRVFTFTRLPIEPMAKRENNERDRAPA
jgi:hypothetical protein